MAKKKTAAKTKKTAARTRVSSSKKTATRSARTKASTKKKTTAKKAPGKKSTAKKVARKKSTAKKATTKKATTKKATTKKATTKKAATKKSTAKKAATKKKASVAKAPAMKAAAKAGTLKKAPKKAAAKPAPKASKAAPAKSKKKQTPTAKDERYSLSEARAAASGLAARAGLKLVRMQAAAEPEEKTKTRQLKKSPLTKAQLEKYREILLKKRAEVAGDVFAMESEAFGPTDGGAFPQHLADQGSDEYEQALSLGLAESQRKLLVEINEALSRINDGTYGICAHTGGPIGRDRLDATPWAKLSVEGARELDRQTYYQ